MIEQYIYKAEVLRLWHLFFKWEYNLHLTAFRKYYVIKENLMN